MLDWSDKQQVASSDFHKVSAIDTVVHTGEILFIPSYWMHYIVALNYAIQSNTRNGHPPSEKTNAMLEQVCRGETVDWIEKMDFS